MSLESKQEERKKRLAQLKAAASAGTKRSNDEEQDKGVGLRFRSYQPDSVELKDFVGEAPAVGPEATEKGLDTVEARVAEIEEKVLEEENAKNPELDLNALAPKKPNWDLKRDLEKKLEKLERRTQNAISDLIRNRLKGEKDISEAAAISAERIEDDED